MGPHMGLPSRCAGGQKQLHRRFGDGCNLASERFVWPGACWVELGRNQKVLLLDIVPCESPPADRSACAGWCPWTGLSSVVLAGCSPCQDFTAPAGGHLLLHRDRKSVV